MFRNVRNVQQCLMFQFVPFPFLNRPGSLRTCVDQLCGVRHNIFNLGPWVPVVGRLPVQSLYLRLDILLRLWLNGYRPVALMSYIMKTQERLGLAHLRPLKKDRLNPWQFASGGHQGLNLLIPPMDNPRKQCQELVFHHHCPFSTLR